MGRTLGPLVTLLLLWSQAQACVPSDSGGSPHGGSAGAPASVLGGAGVGGANIPVLVPESGGVVGTSGSPNPNAEWEPCGIAQFYCETEHCIGVEECQGTGSGRLQRCRCVAQLPSAGGAGGMADSAGAGGELPQPPDPYPGAGCPVVPQESSCDDPCRVDAPCVYGDFALCCGPHGEDCGPSWVLCASSP